MPTFYPKKHFTISGKNMNLVERVMFGAEEVSTLAYLKTTGVSGIVPPAAYTNDVILETSDRVLNLGVASVVLDSASQVVVSGLLSDDVSGRAGDAIEISGENFYQITDVKFGGMNSPSFHVLSESDLRAVVPQNAHYAGVSVFSSLRTGLNGSTSEASGITENKFVPIPEIYSLNSGQLCSGKTLEISGASFSGVTGVSVNAIEMEDFQVNSSTEIQMTVPSGNVRGVPNLLLQSGVSFETSPNFFFSPLARVTGVQDGKILGSSLRVSGENFTSGILYSGIEFNKYLVDIGGRTGLFTLTNDKLLEGTVPTGLKLYVSGDTSNVGAGTFEVFPHAVSLFTSNYPEQYPSDISFTPGIGAPVVTKVVPETGFGGDLITVEGQDLYGLTGVRFISSQVGITSDSQYVTTVVPGKSVAFTLPAVVYPDSGALLGVEMSGYFGSLGSGPASVNVYGKPSVDEIYPDTDVLPGSTGSVYGSRLHSGVTDLYIYDTSINPANFIADLPISGGGYTPNSDQITFFYPNSFTTGVDAYKIRTRNKRGGGATTITTVNSPVFSGFSPLSGVVGDTIRVSGYFEGLVPSGLKIGDSMVSDYSLSGNPDGNGNSGIHMVIPRSSLSDLIKVNTSGGFVSSTQMLGVSAAKPAISGYYRGKGELPSNFGTTGNPNQVFSRGDVMTITGFGLNLTTGVSFSGISGSIDVGNFVSKRPFSLVVDIPLNMNRESGRFIVKDFLSRETPSPYDINITHISGYSNFLLPGETFSLSGDNVTGLDIGFQYLTGVVNSVGGNAATREGYVFTQDVSSSVVQGTEIISTAVPTGITFAPVRITGRENIDGAATNGPFNPLAVILGVSGLPIESNPADGWGDTELSGNQHLSVTGLNSNALTNTPYLGISGSGSNVGRYGDKTTTHLFANSLVPGDVATGMIEINGVEVLYQELWVGIDRNFIGTGHLFLTNSWDSIGPKKIPNPAQDPFLLSRKNIIGQDGRSFVEDFVLPGNRQEFDSGILHRQISYFPDEYNVSGVRWRVTGYSPNRGITGTVVEISGENLNFANIGDVFLQIPQYEDDYISSIGVLPRMMSIPWSGSLDGTLLSGTISEGAVMGDTTLMITGRYGVLDDGEVVGPFEVLPDASVVEYEINTQDSVPFVGSNVSNFTIEETVGGVTFIVTKTLFPDGTTTIISSVPKP